MKRDPSSLGILMDKAHFMHKKGYNCAETVAWALSSYWNLDMNIASVTGLGGGIARSGATCGALTGAIVALGCKVGRVDPADDAKKVLCYRLGQLTTDGFVKELGTSLCKDIIGFVLSETGGAEKYAAGGYKDGKCKDAIDVAVKAAIAAVESLEAQG
ncbi:MAG: C-GCAxxG-C-C family protein [Bacillota bacterium]